LQHAPLRRRGLVVFAVLGVLGIAGWESRSRIEALLGTRRLAKKESAVHLVPVDAVLPQWSGPTRTIETQHWTVDVPPDVQLEDVTADGSGPSGKDASEGGACTRRIWWQDRPDVVEQLSIQSLRSIHSVMLRNTQPVSAFELIDGAFSSLPGDVSMFIPVRELLARWMRLELKGHHFHEHESDELRRAKDGDLGVFWSGSFAREAGSGLATQHVFAVRGEVALPHVLLRSECPKRFTGDEVRLIASTLRRR